MFHNFMKRTRPLWCKMIIGKEFKSCKTSKKLTCKPTGQTIIMSGILTWLGLAPDPNANHDSNLLTTVKRGILASQEGDLKRAQQILHLALRQASEMGDHAAVNHIYCLLADIAIEMNLFGEAERLYIDVMKRIITEGEPQNSNAIVEMSLKLANIQSVREDFNKAEIGFKFCIDSQKVKIEKLGPDVDEDTLALYGLSLDRFAQFLASQNRLSEAESMYETGVEVAKEVLGCNHEQTLVIQNSLATVLSMKGEYKKAEEILTAIIKIAENISCQYLPTFLVNRGVNNLLSGVSKTGEADCIRAKTIASANNLSNIVEEANDCIEKAKLIFQ